MANISLEIVGVVGDVREFGPREDAPVQLYRPMVQDPFAGNVLVRTAGGSGTADPRRPPRRTGGQSGVRGGEGEDAGRSPLGSSGVAADHRAACSASSPPWRW